MEKNNVSEKIDSDTYNHNDIPKIFFERYKELLK